MRDDHLAEQAARLLREARSRIPTGRTATPARAIAELSDVIHRSAVLRRRRRSVLAVAGGAGVCVAVAALVLVLRGGAPAPAPVAQSTSAAASSPAAPFVAAGAANASLGRPGDRLRTQGGALQLYAADGSSMRLAPSSDLQLVRADAERWLRLRSGTVAVHVAKLKRGERFVIMTPDAEVEVRGTRFEVDVVPPVPGCGDGTVTRVAVTEGVVEVRGPFGDVRVPAGSRWPASCGSSAPAADARRADAPIAAAPAGAGPRARVGGRSPADSGSRALSGRTRSVSAAVSADGPAAAPPAASTLATENDLFSSALRAEHDGDRREAVELLDVLLKRFPGSPLRASAVAARERLSRSLPPAP